MIWKFFLGLYLITISKLLEWIPSWTYPSLKFAANLLPISDDNMSFGFKSKKFTSCLGFESDYRHQLWLGSFDPNLKKESNSNRRYKLKLPITKITQIKNDGSEKVFLRLFKKSKHIGYGLPDL